MNLKPVSHGLTVLAVAAATIVAAAPAQAAAQKPNILFIVSDDTGYGDLGPTAAARGAACRRRTSTGWRTKA